MPRVANAPRAQHVSATTPRKQTQQLPMKVPLNDDRQEKAARLQSRQALHDLQINSLKAAASPIRKLNNYSRAASDSPQTPKMQAARGKENDESVGLAVVTGTAMTPMKRMPILANFEEWMKMATDNKINAANSWNFALIDYFHDMSLLKEGDGVNFQKASCTLDGCVKIYTSRVDSVATETGKLLSGLADSNSKKGRRGDGEGAQDGEGEENDEEEEEGEDGVKRKTKKKSQRSSEATLVPSFASLELKKMELEFSVDPLFKKVAADFDEGGAKGLLLNHLSIDGNGRIVFDSSDDVEDVSTEGKGRDPSDADNSEDLAAPSVPAADDTSIVKDLAQDIDIAFLGKNFLPDLAKLDEQHICPSLKNFDLGDPAGALNIPFLKASEDFKEDKGQSQPGGLGDQTGIFLEGDNIAGFDDDDGALGGFDLGGDAAFGEGGEVWAKSAALESVRNPQDPVFEGDMGDGQNEAGVIGVGDFDPASNQHAVSMHHRKEEGGHEDILSYFDNALQKTWAGPEHWRIRRIKDLNKPSTPAPARRKEKEPFEVDFNAPLDAAFADMLYAPPASNSAISMPKTQWKSKTRNLLPDDKHFNSRQLLRLFLKPKARVGSRRLGLGGRTPAQTRQVEEPDGEMDEAFWARKENNANLQSPATEAAQGDYDANFFQDDGLGFAGGPPDDEDFADAKENFSPEAGETNSGESQDANGTTTGPGGTQEGAFGSQLVTQSRHSRPEYVQYARVAKKVDVRRLKEEMWKGIGFEDNISPKDATPEPQQLEDQTAPLKFTSVMNNLSGVYPKEAMVDISTSYCFICLLHLANERGLAIESEPGLEELSIRRDLTAEIVGVEA